MSMKAFSYAEATVRQGDVEIGRVERVIPKCCGPYEKVETYD